MTLDSQPATKKAKYGVKKLRKAPAEKLEQSAVEMRILQKAFAGIPKAHHVLDIPCSGGRVTMYLARKGYWVSGADFSDQMLAIARENIAKNKLECTVEMQDIEQLTYADRSFDTVFCYRVFHYFPTPEVRQSVVSELCRVAKKYVVLSYLSTASVGGVKRQLEEAIGRETLKHATSLTEVRSYFSNAGFKLVKDFARTPIVHTLHVAVFERIQ